MKKFKYIFLTFIMAIFVSCEKETEGISRITVYPVISLNGDAVLSVQKDASFDDPGAVATEGDDDISSTIITDGSVNTSKCDVYSIIYSAKNKDGFLASAERTVIVYNPASPITPGSYNTTINRLPNGSYENLSVIIYGVSDTEIHVSDILGGYYAQGRKYGSNYASPAILSISSDNSIELVSGGDVPAWGDSVDSCTGTYDPTTKVITISTEYAGMTFNSTFVL